MKLLGNSDTLISEIGLGGMALSQVDRPPEAQAIKTIHRALDLGITLIDTADSYCINEFDMHHNEQLISKALHTYQGDIHNVIVVTKGGFIRTQGAWIQNGEPNHLRRTIYESFMALGGEKPIDLWLLHRPDPKYTIEESLTPAKEALEKGLVRFLGLSNFTLSQIKRARRLIDIVAIQNQFNPWHCNPEFDGVLAYCEQEQLTLMASSPFGGIQGARRTGRLEDLHAFSRLATEKKVSIYQIILAWLRAKSTVIVPIVGASKPHSIEDSLKTTSIQLSELEVDQLNQSLYIDRLWQRLRWIKRRARMSF